eukprot:Gb_21374 [translate_table: standard]
MASTTDHLEIHVDSATPQLQKPLLCFNQSQHDTGDPANGETVDTELELDPPLRRLGTVVAWLGLDQPSRARVFLSWFVFFVLGIAAPSVTLWFTACTGCSKIQVTKFEIMVQVSQTCLAGVSLAFIAHNLRKYGLQKFLFVDQFHKQVLRHRDDVKSQLWGAFRLLKWIIFPCLVVKVIREACRILYIHKEPWWENVVILVAILISWFYLTTIFLSACVLFNLVCSLQIVHVDDYAKLFEGTTDVSLFLREHIYLRYQLYKISHRFRIYILVAFLVVTASQFTTLFETTDYDGTINFINTGDFVVCSAVQLVGVVLCLRAAAKITHRAQRIASIASRWHASATCCSSNASESKDEINAEVSTGHVDPIYSLLAAEYESDMESSEDLNFPSDSQLASYVASYHKRQALVTYFQFNHAGITIFGLTVDRLLMNTIFFVELSLILWILGKTVVATSK